jgi:hypothetical protein
MLWQQMLRKCLEPVEPCWNCGHTWLNPSQCRECPNSCTVMSWAEVDILFKQSFGKNYCFFRWNIFYFPYYFASDNFWYPCTRTYAQFTVQCTYWAAGVLSVWCPLPSYDLIFPPLTHCIRVSNITIHTGKGGGELIIEKVRGAKVHKAGRKYQHGWLYSINY